MTNGASQGLFVIVAVVIFGIFVLISYMLFGEKLKTGLADIYSDSFEKVGNDLELFTTVDLINFEPTNSFNKYLKVDNLEKGKILVTGTLGGGIEQLDKQFNVEKNKKYRISISYKVNKKISNEVNFGWLQGAYFLFYEGDRMSNIMNTSDKIIKRIKLDDNITTSGDGYITEYFDYTASSDKINIVLDFSGVRDGTYFQASFKDFKIKQSL